MSMTPEQLAAQEKDFALWQQIKDLFAAHGVKGTLEAIATVAEGYSVDCSGEAAGYWIEISEAVDECVNRIDAMGQVAVLDSEGATFAILSADDGDAICDAVDRGFSVA